MKKTGLLYLFILAFLCNYVNGQDEAIFDSTLNSTEFTEDLIRELPVTNVLDIFQLNPEIYRLDVNGDFLINGFGSSSDYTWFDGMPVILTEEMPLRLIGQAGFDRFIDYYRFSNSLTGFANLEPVQPPDSISFLAETSTRLIHRQFNDADLQFLLSGPLLRKSGQTSRALLSFTLAGRVFSSSDTDPSYVLRNQAAPGYLKSIENDPLRPTSYGGTHENALFTHETDAVASYFNSNAAKSGFSIYGNLRADLRQDMNIQLGTYTVSKNEIIPVYENSFFNQENNPEHITRYSANYLKFEHEFNLNETATFSYDIQGQYIYYNNILQSIEHGDNLLDYGHIGRFDTYKSPTFEIGSDTVDGQFYEQAWILNSWDYDTLVEFTPGSLNPGLAAYTSSYYSIFQGDPEGHYQNYDQILLNGGLVNGLLPNPVYGLYNNTGTVYNGYSRDDNRELNIMANGRISIGKHEVQLGFRYDRKSYASYQVNPAGLWWLMDHYTNFQLLELDTDHPYLHKGEGLDTVFYYREFNGEHQYSFDRRLREVLGLDPDGLDFIDINSYDHDHNTIAYFDKEGNRKLMQLDGNPFTMKLFSPEELYFYGSNLYCMGFNHLGEKTGEKASLNDFFNATDENGNFTRPVNGYTPLNYSGYAAYHAILKGWSVDAGLKMEAFNSNQMVLKDPYLWVEAYSVGEMDEVLGYDFIAPDGIGNDFVVYVDNAFNPIQITGYRQGYQWFDAGGNPLENPDELNVGSGISPYVKDADQVMISPAAYKSSKVMFSLLPQVQIQKGFNRWFGISLRYNSSVKQPYKFYSYSDPSRYMYFYAMPFNYLPNGSLEPERADHFMAGVVVQPFRRTSVAVNGIADHYTSLIFPYYLDGAYPVGYLTFKNSDKPCNQYGAEVTVKHNSGKSSGFDYGISYRYLHNDEKEEYLLYFDQKAPASLLKGYLAYNTGFGNDYSGPSGKTNYRIFESLGVGAFAQMSSGVSYAFGNLYSDYENEKMPVAAFLDLKLEKGFHFKNDQYLLNIYCVLQNVFNTKLVYGVYNNTGKPDDDGYLDAPENQKEISEALDEESYRFLYASYINDPSHYGQPRRTTFGILFGF